MRLRRDLSAADRAAYLRALQTCFPGWGNEADFAWWFMRPTGGPPADLLALDAGGELIAGTAVVYRRLSGSGSAGLAGVMCGAWTLPAWRGRGAFAALVGHALATAEERGAVMLLAFAALERDSHSTLTRLFDFEIPAWTCTTSGLRGGDPEPAEPTMGSDEIGALLAAQRRGLAFAYDDPEVLAGHLRLRDKATSIVVAGADHVAIVRAAASFTDVVAVVAREGVSASARSAGAALAELGERARLRAFTTEEDLARGVDDARQRRSSLFATGIGAATIPLSWSLQGLDRA